MVKSAVFTVVAVLFLLAGCNSHVLSTSEVSAAGTARGKVLRRNDPPAVLDLAQAEKLLNQYRKRYRLGALSFDPLLQHAAEAHAAELARHSRVSHTGRNGSNPAERVRQAGYRWSSVGENVSAGRNTIPEVIKAWHNSPLHRKNLQLVRAVHFGFAVAHNPKSKLSNYWVLLVGAPEHAGQPRRGGKSGMRIGIGG